MSTRIYDARLLDFQIAQCSDAKSATGGLLLWNKKNVEAALSAGMDKGTLSTISERFVPVSLRWRTSPALGLPYSPFKVYKRNKSLPFAGSTVSFFSKNNAFYFLNGPYWQITFTLTNTGMPADFIVAPLDQYQAPIPDVRKTIHLDPLLTTTITFKVPNINGIIILSGEGTISKVSGIRMEDFMNDSNWQLIETVGMPYKTGTPNVTAYQNSDQGFPLAPVSGYQAAVNRVTIAKLFIQSPTLAQPDGTTLPAWTLPQPLDLINSFHKKKDVEGQLTGILHDIEEMLTRVQSSPMLYDGKQANFRKKYKVKGFSDDGVNYSENASVENPVCGTTLLGVSTDCWNAIGLGFGTTDLANMDSSAQNQFFLTECDYMVCASFRLPKYKNVFWDLTKQTKIFHEWETYEIASLAHPALPIPVVKNLNNENFSENRPIKLDANFSDDVKLFWDKPGPNVPTSYVVAVKDTFTNQLAYLNADRPFTPGVKRPYLAASRADNDAQEGKGSDAANLNRFYHHRSLRSDAVPVSKNYYVAATDVFGRWSAFQKTVNTLPEAPMMNADIITGKFILDPYGTINQANTNDLVDHIYPGMLELVVAWHWDDRTPFEINIGGQFVPLPFPDKFKPESNIVKSPGIWLDKDGIRSVNLSIGFNGTVPFVKNHISQPPVVANKLVAEVIEDKVNSAPPHTIGYKIRIKGFNFNFETVSKLAFAVYVKSSVKNAPAKFTSFGNPKMIYALDPLPRKAPVLPPEIQWGSLPDATNVSRFRVSFPAVSNVAGYAIYRATEAALREKLGLLPIVASKKDIYDRHTELLSFAGNNKKEERNIAKDAFIRISSDLIPNPVTDVELPGDLDGLYIYAMTTFTDQRVESDFSSWLFVSVPRRYTPPAPVLTAFTKKNGAKREVRLRIEVPQGIRTETVEVFSTSKSYLAASLNLMGLPITGGLKEMPPEWKAYDENDVLISPVNLNSKVRRYEITSLVDPGWQPIHYRAAGLGVLDDGKGKFPGRSKSSNMIAIQVAPPDNGPEIDAALMPLDATLWRMDILAGVDIHPTPFGNFRLTVQKLDTTLNLYKDIRVWDVPDIRKRLPDESIQTETLYRVGKDASGKYEFELYAFSESEAWYQIIVTDPLGRTDAVKVHYKTPVTLMQNLVVKSLATSVEISFDTNVINKPPIFGHYKLEIYVQSNEIKPKPPQPSPIRIYSGFMEHIGTAIPATATSVYMSPPVHRSHLFTYHAVFTGAGMMGLFVNASVTIIITDPNGKSVTLTNKPGKTQPQKL